LAETQNFASLPPNFYQSSEVDRLNKINHKIRKGKREVRKDIFLKLFENAAPFFFNAEIPTA
jgi:hypothetical protein